ncbi:hypothetical protein PGTUg99_015561 [Puccinia graminis f. sp. tritici]|uniref:Uncharacterized protein n=1 Tax=Puccinia graminis f. sp. tritici TaxID=56615 RepID=A0A5B0SD07_PUCGR|nr:hypothetical protein PGTUg99_015561 [Puccinia graminis f. sp. tritici]
MEQRTIMKKPFEKTSASLEIVRVADPIHVQVQPLTSERRWIPKLSEAKLLLIASTGFFIGSFRFF